VERVNVGDRVIAFTGWGGFAEEVAAEARKLIPIPDGIDFSTAAAFTLVYGTAHHALRDRAQLRAGETLLVLGASGGVGLAAVEIGKVMGARVIAAASSDEKLAVCKQHGADEVINYSTEDIRERVKVLTEGNGVDVVFDPVGGNYSEPVLRSIAWNGRFLVIGFATGDIPRIPLNLPLLKGCSIVGVFWGSFTEREPKRNQEHLQELLKWLAEGKLKPHISATYPLERAAEALNAMMNRTVKGKVVLLTEV
jgi:NADPH:quinone reductase